MPTIFQENIDKTLEYQTPAWQDEIIIATRSTAEEHMDQVSNVLAKMERAGYNARKEKSKFLRDEVNWLGFRIKNVITPLREKTEAIRKLKPPKNIKEVRSFLGSAQYLIKHIPKLSEKTARIRELLKKESTWKWNEEHERVFNDIKGELEIPKKSCPF